MARVSLGEVIGPDDGGEDRQPVTANRDGATAEPLPAPAAPTKYTLLLSPRDEDRAKRVTDDVVRLSGVKPRKQMRGDVIRILFAIAADDEDLRRQLAERLRAVEARRRDVEV